MLASWQITAIVFARAEINDNHFIVCCALSYVCIIFVIHNAYVSATVR